MVELEISFEGKTTIAMVYVRMDACDQHLLSEGIRHQLRILHYHPSTVRGSFAFMEISNPTSFTQHLSEELELGEASEVSSITDKCKGNAVNQDIQEGTSHQETVP